MEKIGYSLVDPDGKELQFWGDTAGQETGVPNVVRWPNGDQTHCPEVGMTHDGCRLVPRYLIEDDGRQGSIEFDGQNVVVTRAP